MRFGRPALQQGENVPDESSGAAAGAGDAEHHEWLYRVGCLVPLLAVLIGAASLGLHYVVRSPVSPYQVTFSPSGEACDRKPEPNAELNFDEDSGELLSCGFVGMPGGDDTQYVGTAFSAAEIAQVANLSRRLGSDGDLSHADRTAVYALGARISRAHGWTRMSPSWADRLTWWLGLAGLIGGVGVLMLVGLRAQLTESRPRPIHDDGSP